MRIHKRMLIGMTAALLMGMAGTANGQQTIDGSAHDFEGVWSQNEICLPCHTTHVDSSLYPSSAAPLWNHEITNFATFTTYDGTTNVAAAAAFDEISILCMSCHDGQTAMDNFNGTTGGLTVMLPGAAGFVGTDLQYDHPVGSTGVYDGAKPGYQTNPLNALPLYTDPGGGGLDVVGCASCHEPHNNVPVGQAHFVRLNNTGSALCLSCHIK